jgi:hypothetical protein
MEGEAALQTNAPMSRTITWTNAEYIAKTTLRIHQKYFFVVDIEYVNDMLKLLDKSSLSHSFNTLSYLGPPKHLFLIFFLHVGM